MKTLICQQPGVMEYVEKDIPTPADNEVLLKIKAVVFVVLIFTLLPADSLFLATHVY